MFSKGRKSRLKERTNHPTTLGANQMAQVTYRGVQYDTNRNKTQQNSNKVELTYRGVRQVKELTNA